MMGLAAGEIGIDEFDAVLSEYPALIKRLSDSKTPTPEGESLEELDIFRFETAPHTYGEMLDKKINKTSSTSLEKEDVLKLVRWKLKHGTFRPKLLQLVASNSKEDITKTTFEAFKAYDNDNTDILKAVKILIGLKGIGPATASLLLSIHDPRSVVFFGDEVYQWLCCAGEKKSLKYNLKEYQELATRALEFRQTPFASVDARDLEKVGFVVMRDPDAVMKKAAEKPLPKDEETYTMELKARKDNEDITPPPQTRTRKTKRTSSAGDDAASSRTTSKRMKRNGSS